MPPIVQGLIKLSLVAVVIFAAFKYHIGAGIGVLVLLLAFWIYKSRSAIYAQQGNVAYMKGDMKTALAKLEKAYQTKPYHPQHIAGYGFLLAKAGETDQAERVLNEVLSGQLSNEIRLQAQVNLATVYWLQGKQDEAHNLLETVYETFKNTTVYGNLGYFKLLRGELDDALRFNLEAYEYNDGDVTILDNLAQTYYLLGRHEEAAEMYAKAVDKSPKHAESYYYYALTLQKLGRLEEAAEQISYAKHKELALITTVTKDQIETLAKQLEQEVEPESESEPEPVRDDDR